MCIQGWTDKYILVYIVYGLTKEYRHFTDNKHTFHTYILLLNCPNFGWITYFYYSYLIYNNQRFFHFLTVFSIQDQSRVYDGYE